MLIVMIFKTYKKNTEFKFLIEQPKILTSENKVD